MSEWVDSIPKKFYGPIRDAINAGDWLLADDLLEEALRFAAPVDGNPDDWSVSLAHGEALPEGFSVDEDSPNHGLVGYKKQGCRCYACKAANAEYHRKYRAKKRNTA